MKFFLLKDFRIEIYQIIMAISLESKERMLFYWNSFKFFFL